MMVPESVVILIRVELSILFFIFVAAGVVADAGDCAFTCADNAEIKNNAANTDTFILYKLL